MVDRYNHTVRKITPSGLVTTIAGLAGSSGTAGGIGCTARFYRPSGIYFDRRGNLYVLDYDNHRISRGVPLEGSEPPPYIESLGSGSNGTVVIQWSSVTNHRYSIHYSTNLLTGFTVLQSNILATPAMNSYTDSVATVTQEFWKVTTDP